MHLTINMCLSIGSLRAAFLGFPYASCMVGRNHSNFPCFCFPLYKNDHQGLAEKVRFPMSTNELFPEETKMHPFFKW